MTEERTKPTFDGKRFSNPAGPTLAKPHHLLRWILTRKSAKWPRHLPNPPADPVAQRVEGTRLRITLINHATVLIQGGGLNILTDPVFSQRVSPVSFAGPRRHRLPGIPLQELPPIDAILISHTHYDHLDLHSIRQLHDRDKPLILAPLNTSHHISKVCDNNAVELNWWDREPLTTGNASTSDFTATFVPSLHWTSRSLGDQNTSLWGGYVVSLPGGHIYFAGDTGYGTGQHFLQAVAEFHSFRCALIPIGAYEPRWFMKPQHMNPAEAVQAFENLQAKHAIGIHHGTFKLTDEAHDQPVLDLQVALEASRVAPEAFRALGNGQSWDIPEDESLSS